MADAKERGRARLDSLLTSPVMSQRAGIVRMVRDQLLARPALDKHYHARSKETIDKVAERRATEIFSFVDALRSARQELLDNQETPFSWKIKEETDAMRVMYRPGPEGAPFHTYCVEGIVNGPVVNAVCVAWEAPAFHTWWPQFSMPTFKVVESKWVKRIRIGEDLSHIRVKVPWPMAQREVLMTEFELEYPDEDIVIVVLGTAPSDPDEGEEEIYGFSADELPSPTQDVVRIDVSGGFMLQKMNNEQSYFRTVVNMDIKLDFVPPWVINFVTRQLVGSGYKLYQKAVLSASKHKIFQKLITSEPLYRGIDGRANQQTEIQTDADKVEDETASPPTQAPVAEEETAAPLKAEELELVERFRTQKNRAPGSIPIGSDVEHALQVLDKIIELVEDMKSSRAAAESAAAADSADPASTSGLENGDKSPAAAFFRSSEKNFFTSSGRNCFGSGTKLLPAAKQQQRSKLALLKEILRGKFKRKDR